MRKIAILCGRYLPGYKDGGPLRTVVNICECLGEEYSIRIITNDRDHGDDKPYPNIIYDAPNKVGNAEVWYLPPKCFTKKRLIQLIKDVDVVYCCGPYDDYARNVMWLKKKNKFSQPLVIASMGVFSAGALKLKKIKKRLYFFICKLLGLFRNVAWSVTSEKEEYDVKKNIGKKAVCYVAEDLPRKVPKAIEKKANDEKRGVFISRICEMKNLMYALDVLKEVKSPLWFDVYGVIEDKEYWEKCQIAIKELPSNIKCEYKGDAEPEKVIQIFSEYDFFLFPTLGENYGHVIFESLAGKCIPIISDQTPWTDLLEKEVGVVASLKEKQSFINAVEEMCLLNVEQLREKQNKAKAYAEEKYEQTLNNTGYRKIFEL